MPCDNHTADTHNDYNCVMSDISLNFDNNNIDYCVIGGDVNTDLSRDASNHTLSLNHFYITRTYFIVVRVTFEI